MKRRLLTALFALALCVGLIPFARATGTPDPSTVRSNGSPYYIMVNRAACAVTVYTLDSAGYYSVPLRAMICSVGKEGNETPTGTYKLTSFKVRWLHMVDDSYGQYNSQFYGNFLFHSVCYSEKSSDTLFANEYNDLGSAVSQGCVRLQTADAKWIYDNCPVGTVVVVYDDVENPSPLGMPQKAIAYLDPDGVGGTFDPTDPDKNNPWLGKVATGITLDRESVELTVGHRTAVTATVTPATANAELRWQSSDPSVATVDERGNIIAQGAGTARISVNTGSYYAHLTVTVTGEALCFTDVPAGASYYDDVRYVYENGLMSGSGNLFLPREPLNRVMGFQILYNLSGNTVTPAAEPWYSAVLQWAVGNGMSQGMSVSSNSLLKPLSREDFAVLLYRFEVICRQTAPQADGDLTQFTDWEKISSFSEEAMAWAVGLHILEGDDVGALRPDDMITRAEAAQMLRCYSENRSAG